jgi:hypothetical protein
VENETHKQSPRPSHCPPWGTVGRMLGHGNYRRKPKELPRACLLRFRRWRCQACKRTTSYVPSFLLSFRHYLVNVTQAVLVAQLEMGGACLRSSPTAARTACRRCERCNGGRRPSPNGRRLGCRLWVRRCLNKTATGPGWSHDRQLVTPVKVWTRCCWRPRFTCWPGPRRAGRKWLAPAWRSGSLFCGIGVTAASWAAWSS